MLLLLLSLLLLLLLLFIYLYRYLTSHQRKFSSSLFSSSFFFSLSFSYLRSDLSISFSNRNYCDYLLIYLLLKIMIKNYRISGDVSYCENKYKYIGVACSSSSSSSSFISNVIILLSLFFFSLSLFLSNQQSRYFNFPFILGIAGRVDKYDSSFQRSRSSSMSSLENITTETISCLTFADSYTKKSGTFPPFHFYLFFFFFIYIYIYILFSSIKIPAPCQRFGSVPL